MIWGSEEKHLVGHSCRRIWAKTEQGERSGEGLERFGARERRDWKFGLIYLFLGLIRRNCRWYESEYDRVCSYQVLSNALFLKFCWNTPGATEGMDASAHTKHYRGKSNLLYILYVCSTNKGTSVSTRTKHHVENMDLLLLLPGCGTTSGTSMIARTMPRQTPWNPWLALSSSVRPPVWLWWVIPSTERRLCPWKHCFENFFGDFFHGPKRLVPAHPKDKISSAFQRRHNS